MRNYKDLQVWSKAHALTLELYRATRRFPAEERFGLTGQIRRASLSIGANLAEGCGRRSDGELARYVQIALGSATELSYHLLVARDLGLLEAVAYERLLAQADEVMRMLAALGDRVRTSSSSQTGKARAAAAKS
jgi:four helix bundle protein